MPAKLRWKSGQDPETLKRALAVVEGAAIEGLSRGARAWAELIVNHAREHGTFTDRTGNLRASIQVYLVEVTNVKVRVQVGAGGDPDGRFGGALVYAPYVEFGTSKAPPYPYLGPAIEATKADGMRLVAKAVENAIRRALSGGGGAGVVRLART